MRMNFRYARGMIDLFDYVYKQGVADARKASLSEDVDEFVASMSEPTSYGLFGSTKKMTWKQWRSRLFMWSFETRQQREHLQEYLRLCDAYKGVFACIYPISYQFYLRGLVDGIRLPMSEYHFEKFMGLPNTKLEKFIAGRYDDKITMREYTGLVHEISYKLADDEAEMEHGARLKETSYTKFADAFWNVISAYYGRNKAMAMAKRIKRAKNDLLSQKILGYDKNKD